MIGASAQAATVPGTAVDGPSADVGTAVDVDLAADGTGAITWLKKEGGQDHVFVSLVSGGSFGAPQRVDTGLALPSRRPSVAAAGGGRVVVAFLNGNGPQYTLHAALKTAGAGFDLPTGIVLDPAVKGVDLEMNEAGIAYAVFGAVGGATDVRAARLEGSTWTQVGAPFPAAGGVLDAVPAKDAGPADGQREARVAVTSSGNAVVAWTEEGVAIGDYDTYARRIAGTTISNPAVLANEPSLEGFPSAKSADMADLDVEQSGDAWVVFRQTFDYGGGATKPRDLARKLIGDSFGGAQILDGLTSPPGEGAEFPRIDLSPGGRGLVAMPRQLSFETWGSSLSGTNWSTGFRVDGLTNSAPSFPVSAIGENGGLVAWRQRAALGEPTSLLGRYYADAPADETVLSNATFGTVDGGPEAASDASGNVVVVFTQLSGADRRVVAAVVDAPAEPGPDPDPDPDPGLGTFGSNTLVDLLVGRRLRAERKSFRLRIRNRNTFLVTGSATVRTVKAFASAKRKRLVAQRNLQLLPGKTTRVKFKLTRLGRRLLAREGSLRVKATLRLLDPAGKTRTVTKRFWLLAARP